MPVATHQEMPPPFDMQMELPIAALLRRRAALPSARLPRVRRDTLPERTSYHDDGCEIHPQCLTCPLPRCRFEEPGGLQRMLIDERDRKIVELRSRGLAVEDIAGRFGVSRRTVFRVLTAKYKEVRCA